jgi:predicted ATPase
MLKSCPQTLMEISNELVKVFESDFSVLARLLPNINVVFPKLAKPTEDADGARNLQGMNLNNVCYTLQRFMRIVSSTVTPVMLFLDDLQWAGNTSLELINAILSDKRGSSCFLFVGCYRDNEVQEGHPIIHLMSSLDSSGVKSTKLQLGGLSRNCLNLMISESLGILPHLFWSLGNIIYEKTGGNPYFALEFLRSLVDRRLLKYSLRERRWIWDESKIRSENITDNVLHLLAAKMTSLPEDIQSALRIVSCFGIKIDQTIVDYLCLDPQFTQFSDRLFKTVDESFVQKIDTGFKFIHDKVREAAYSLIPDGVKSQVSQL